MKTWQTAGATVLAMACLGGCATTNGGPLEPAGMQVDARDGDESAGPTQVGLATFYARRFAGRRMASGKLYDPDALIAAHRTLAFGTRVRVTNLENHRSVVVVIADRGPFHRARIIDLSRRAARRLDMIGAGVARVRVEPLLAADSD